MKHLLGFIFIWIAVGMTIMLFIANYILALLIIMLLFIIGYHLFSC